ncbi:MAG: hypothetical protein MUF21_11495, partial [Gemmatimonadaceae bacterium]|nr:hypothetical protein [Gemmatimonadaceae bacterium]
MSRPTLLAAALAILGLAGGASVPVLLDRERTWRDEAAALRGQHDPARLAADSLRDATDATRRTLVAARLRAASRAEATLHLELQRDSGRLLLVRDGIELRRMPVRLTGPLPPVGVRA